jgi:hypothetical protein
MVLTEALLLEVPNCLSVNRRVRLAAAAVASIIETAAKGVALAMK